MMDVAVRNVLTNTAISAIDQCKYMNAVVNERSCAG
jgi:hypothetical protein